MIHTYETVLYLITVEMKGKSLIPYAVTYGVCMLLLKSCQAAIMISGIYSLDSEWVEADLT